MMQAFGRGNRALMLADTGRYRACLDEAQAVLDLSASLGMAAAPGLLILWWRLLSYAGLGDWDAVTALEPEARRAIAAGAGTNVVYRLAAQLARGAAARGEGDLAVARVAGRPDGGARVRRLLRDPGRAGGAVPGRVGRGGDRTRARGRRGGVRAGLPLRLRLVPGPRGAAVGERPRRRLPLGDERLGRGAGLTSRRDRTRSGAAASAPAPPPCSPGRSRPGSPGAAAAARPGRRLRPRGAARVGRRAGRAARRRGPRLADADGRGDRRRPRDHARAAGRRPTPRSPAAAERARGVLERRPRPPMRIETFGGLRLYRAGARVPDSAFGRAKARALLGALVCAGPRGVHRDRLLEHLWPELPPERGARALDTTLHELRRTLEPLAQPRSGGSLVAREGEVYRLGLGERDSWDAGEFLELARARPAPPTRSPSGACSRPRPSGAATSCPISPTSPGGGHPPRARARAGRAAGAPRGRPGRDGPPRSRHRALPPAHRERPRARGLAPLPHARLLPGGGEGRSPCASSTPAAPPCAHASASSPAPRRGSSTPRCSRRLSKNQGRADAERKPSIRMDAAHADARRHRR